LNKQTAEEVTDAWARRNRPIEQADEQEAQYDAVRRALISLLPDEEPERWTISPGKPPEMLVLGKTAIWTIGMGEEGVTVRQRPINPEKMRLSVLEQSSEVHAETGKLIGVVRKWTLTDGPDCLVLANTKHYSRRPATSDDERGERFAHAVASALSWVVPSS
jgi:hypothetical protein